MTNISVSEDCILDRLNDYLYRFDFTMMKTDENSPVVCKSSNYYCLNMGTGNVIELHIHLEAFAREIGVMREGEVIVR